MPDYRRARLKGGIYFFTLTTLERRPILTDERRRTALRQTIIEVKSSMPFEILAWVLLPDHLHTLWQLPEGDANFSARWSSIKRRVTQKLNARSAPATNPSRLRRREGTLWQRRFWEHSIRNDADFERHIDYIHYNPVKHGYVAKVADWPYSTFHRYVRDGVYPEDWARDDNHPADQFGE